MDAHNESKRDSKEANVDLSRRDFLRNAGLIGLAAAAPVVLSGTPADAFSFVSQPSPDEQKKLGDQAAQQILKQYREIKDGRERHFSNLGQRLVDSLPDDQRKLWDFKFHVLDSKTVNAFALPGGNMFMFTGLYSQVGSDDELAAVTGHEMTHVRMQHWAKAYQKNTERDAELGIFLSIIHANRNVQSFASVANSTYTLKYSRSEETQADAGGLDNMVAAGYNPQGMLNLFHTLQRLSGNGGGLGGDFFSDHPLTSARIEAAKKQIARMRQDGPFPPLTPLYYNRLIG